MIWKLGNKSLCNNKKRTTIHRKYISRGNSQSSWTFYATIPQVKSMGLKITLKLCTEVATPAIVNNILLTANWQKVSEKLTKSVKTRQLWKLQVSIEGPGLSVPGTANWLKCSFCFEGRSIQSVVKCNHGAPTFWSSAVQCILNYHDQLCTTIKALVCLKL